MEGRDGTHRCITSGRPSAIAAFIGYGEDAVRKERLAKVQRDYNLVSVEGERVGGEDH